LKGSPYTLHDHFPFAPLFRTRMSRNLVVKSGRQVSKSTSLASNGVILANAIPFFSTLYVTPLFDQARRLSANYVRPFIEQSPVKSLWSSPATENSVLSRSFMNNSRLHFSFALLDADRIRGISADRICIDEV
jgi:phage terminase large subunit GpA-like protein